jgi:hypothetical protein
MEEKKLEGVDEGPQRIPGTWNYNPFLVSIPNVVKAAIDLQSTEVDVDQALSDDQPN